MVSDADKKLRHGSYILNHDSFMCWQYIYLLQKLTDSQTQHSLEMYEIVKTTVHKIRTKGQYYVVVNFIKIWRDLKQPVLEFNMLLPGK
jgi:hypothetical protein